MKKCVPVLGFLLGLLLNFVPALANAQCGAGQTTNSYCYGQGEVNNVAFEFCPTAGSTAQSTINSGNFIIAPNTLTVYSGATGSGTAGTIVFGPTTGNVSGNVINGADADECLIFVINSLPGAGVTCQDGFSDPLVVCSESVAGATSLVINPDTFCETDGIQTLGGGLPTGGVYSGDGVTDDGNGTTFTFNPATAGAGTTTVTYNNGGNMAMDDITVFASGGVSFTAPANLCIDAGIQTNLGGGTPAGGTYSGPGVTDNGNGTYNFNPAVAGLGVHTISYTEASGCMEVAMDDVEVLAACGCPEGQDSYFACYGNMESNLVAFEVCPTAGLAAKATIATGTFPSGDNLTVYQGATGSGTAGTIVFGPSSGNLSGTEISGNLADNCLIFVINSDIFGSCQDGFASGLAVCGESIGSSVNFTDPGDFCSNAGVQSGLGGGTPTGGVYSGAGVTDDGNGMTFTFDPAVAGVGTTTITYTNGAEASVEVEVFAAGSTNFTAPADLCIDAGVQTNLGGGSPAGGTYSGPGVTDNGNGTYNFNPAIAGLGVHTITYTDATACAEMATDQIEVLAACGCPMGETSYFHCYGNGEADLVIFEVCPSAGEFAQATINSGLYNTGDDLTVYQGASGSGTAGSIVFGPSNGDLSGTEITANAADECLIFVSNSDAFIASCQDGFASPLSVCGRSLANLVTFTALDDLSVNAGVQTGLSGGLPTGGVYSGNGVTDDGNGMTYTFDPAVAGQGTTTITYTVGGESASDDVEVFNLTPPNFNKEFMPATASLGGVTSLVFTIDNTGSSDVATDLDFTDNLPAGMMVAANPNISNTCTGGTLSATTGSSTISYTGGSVAAGSSCVISVDVMVSTPGILMNTSGDLTSSLGNSGNASDELFVTNGSDRVLFSKAFSPSTINVGEKSRLTFTLDNSNNGGNVFNIFFSDMFPDDMIIASPSNLENTCIGSALITEGAGTFTFGSGFLTPGQSCEISFDVEITSTNPGLYYNKTAELSSTAGASGSAIATLTVEPKGELFIDKSFEPSNVVPGEVTNLTFTIENNNRDHTATGVSFTDDLDAMLSGATLVGAPINDVCGAGSVVTGTSTINLTGGTIAPEGSCTITVPVMIPAGATPGTYTNVTSAVTGTIDGNTVTGNTTTEDLIVDFFPEISKTFLDNPVFAGDNTTIEFTINNTSSTDAISNLSFSDPLSDFINGSSVVTLPTNGFCNGSGGSFNDTNNNNNTVFFNSISLAAGGSCTFTLEINIPDQVNGGIYTNTTAAGTATIDGRTVTVAPASADLEVTPVPILSKSFTNNPVNAGDLATLEFTLEYDAGAAMNATNITFTDDLDAVLSGLVAENTPSNACGGTISGTSQLTFAGGTLTPGETCTFTVDVRVPAGVNLGTYTNTTSELSGTVDGQSFTSDFASADLIVGGINFTKEFISNPVLPGDLTTLRFTIENETAFDATSITFTDNLGGVLSGLVAEAPLPFMPCGAGSTVSGTNFLIFTGGEVAANSSCTFDVQVRVPGNANDGTYNNTTSNLIATIDGNPTTLGTASDNLVVDTERLQLTKSFTDDPVQPGNNVMLEYTLTNLDPNNAIDNIAFTDDLDNVLSGLQAVNLPAAAANGTLSGTGLISLSGGSLAAGQTIMFTVDVMVPVSATPGAVLESTTSEVTGQISGTPVSGTPASDDLFIQGLNLTKSMAGPAEEGGTTTITFTLTNSSPSAISDIEFTDDLDAFISGMTVVTLPENTSTCGEASAVMGTSEIMFGRGALGVGQSCSFDVEVMIPCGTAAGMYTNTTSEVIYNAGTATAPAASDMLQVIAPSASGSFTALADLCLNAGVQTGLSGGLPTGGTYSGTGVTDDGNGMTYSFDPAVAGIGTTTITYTVLDDNGCNNVDYTDDVEVFALPNVTFTAPADLCIDAGVQAGLGGGTPTGGVYSGTGVTDDGNGMTFSFDPAVAGVGTTTITYTFTDGNGCTDSANDDVEVFALPNVTFTAPADLCIDAGVQAGLGGGTPTGGVYSGTGVTDDGNGMTYSFDPAVAGVGTTTITYTFTDGNGCTDSANDDVEVFALPNVTFTAPADLCIDAGVQTGLGGGTPTGGVYSGTGVTDDGNGMTFSFDPAVAGVGTTTITYTFTDGNGCTDSANDDVEVFALPNVTFTAPADLCIDAGVQTGLGGGTPTGGVYSGTGVTDDGNGMTYSFDPAAAGVGTTTITYTFTDGNGCTDSANDDVEVFALPTVTFTAPADLCVDAGVQAGLGGGTPTGGVYSGTGVTDDGNGMTYSFDPAAAGDGTTTITYTFTDGNGCTDSANDDVEVFPLPSVTLTAPDDLCEDQGEQTMLGGGLPTGGIYSGTGVTDNGDGMTFTFDPGAVGIGNYTITYTFTDGNGCSDSATDNLAVLAKAAAPVAGTTSKEFCPNPDLTASLANTGINITTSLSANEKVVWVLTAAPAGSAYAVNDEFTTDDCGDLFKDFGELAVANSSKVIRVQDVANAPVGTYEFEAFVINCESGCTSERATGFSITVFEVPSVMITADLPIGIGRDICLGQTDVEYNAAINSTDGGTYTYAWCAYNSGDGSGSCFNGFSDNTAQNPTRSWTSSAGMKSVGVTVESDVNGCAAEDLYSFEVVEPTMVACPDDQVFTLITDPMTFDCAADIAFNHPEVTPGPCDPVMLSISISGPGVNIVDEAVTPGAMYTNTFAELGEYLVSYQLVDAVGNMSDCSFMITVDGLPCGWVDDGGIGECAGENDSDYDLENDIYSVTSNGCVQEHPYTSDDQAFIYTQLCGDGYIKAFVEDISNKGIAGVALRETVDPGSKKVELGTDRVSRLFRTIRVLEDYPAFPQMVISYDKFWLKIERTGNTFRALASVDDITYIPYLFQTIQMDECLTAGLWANSTNSGDVVIADFSNVEVVESSDGLQGVPQQTVSGQQAELTFDVSLQPNPAKDEVFINLSQLLGADVQIQLYNVNGELLRLREIQGVQEVMQSMDLSNLPKGAYWVKVQSASGQKTLKLIKQ